MIGEDVSRGEDLTGRVPATSGARGLLAVLRRRGTSRPAHPGREARTLPENAPPATTRGQATNFTDGTEG